MSSRITLAGLSALLRTAKVYFLSTLSFTNRVCIVLRKGGNLNNAIYNIFQPEAAFLVILDADMVPAEDFLQLSLPLFFTFDRNAPPSPDAAAAAAAATLTSSSSSSSSRSRSDGVRGGRWVCPWEVGMVASPQAYRNLDSNGAEDDPLNQKNESYTRYTTRKLFNWSANKYTLIQEKGVARFHN